VFIVGILSNAVIIGLLSRIPKMDTFCHAAMIVMLGYGIIFQMILLQGRRIWVSTFGMPSNM
jgi:hypothetical protein